MPRLEITRENFDERVLVVDNHERATRRRTLDGSGQVVGVWRNRFAGLFEPRDHAGIDLVDAHADGEACQGLRLVLG